MRIWQAGKKRESLHIFDPIVNGIGNALMIGTEVHMFFEAKQTGIYTGVAKLFLTDSRIMRKQWWSILNQINQKPI